MVSSITDMINNIAVHIQYLLHVVTASLPRKEEVSCIMYILV